MGDRRIGDRREKEKGVIRIKFKDAVKYVIIGIVLLISIATNIVLAIKLNQYKKIAELYLNIENSILGDESVDIDELMKNIDKNNQ